MRVTKPLERNGILKKNLKAVQLIEPGPPGWKSGVVATRPLITSILEGDAQNLPLG